MSMMSGVIAPTRTGNGPGNQSRGFPYVVVQINSITDSVAQTTDQLGHARQIDIRAQRAKGLLPFVGEYWIIDNTLGFWSFACCLQKKVPTVTGSTDNNPALQSLISALATAGLITDETTTTRIRSDFDHTHVAPPGGGVTSTETPTT